MVGEIFENENSKMDKNTLELYTIVGEIYENALIFEETFENHNYKMP